MQSTVLSNFWLISPWAVTLNNVLNENAFGFRTSNFPFDNVAKVSNTIVLIKLSSYTIYSICHLSIVIHLFDSEFLNSVIQAHIWMRRTSLLDLCFGKIIILISASKHFDTLFSILKFGIWNISDGNSFSFNQNVGLNHWLLSSRQTFE